MVTASPSTRKRALDAGLDVETIARNSGRRHIAQEDVERAMTGETTTYAPTAGPDHAQYWAVDHAAHGPVHEEPMERIAQLASANLSAANATIPQVTHHDRASMLAVEALRARFKDEATARGVKLTALAFHVKGLARCLIDFPRFNASLTPDAKTLILKNYVHVGIAVDTPHGLMVPVIRDADRKGLWQIAQEIAELAKKAQDRKLKAQDMGGASMSISNLGGIGGRSFTPIVNPPEVAILGLTRKEMQPVWSGEKFEPVPFVPLDLSYDHRVVNGADAAKFLVAYAAYLADPESLIVPRIAVAGER